MEKTETDTKKNDTDTEKIDENYKGPTVSTIKGFVPLTELKMILPHEHIPYCHLSANYTTTKQKMHPFLNSNEQKNYLGPDCTVCTMYNKKKRRAIFLQYRENKEILINRGHHTTYPYTPISVPMCPHYYALMIKKELVTSQIINVKTIVENTSYGLMRNISELLKFSKDEKIETNIIVGTGYYAANVQNEETLSLSIEEMYKIMKRDLTENCLTSNENANENANIDKILAGFIGTVGISSPIHEFEKRSICATAQVQSELGCPVSFSPAMGTCDYREVLRIYQEAGGKSDKVVMTHVDCTLIKKKELITFLDDTKCYIQFSMFGDDWSFNRRNDNLDMLSDAQRIKRLKLLKDKYQLNRVLISHDIHTDNRMTYYGGHGYGHISGYIKSRMSCRGLNENDFKMITYVNPMNWLYWNQKSKI